MTIRMRMILSHILVCVLPIIMTLFVLASSLAGLILYAKAGNHVMPESDYQFDTITWALSMDIFHTMRHGGDPQDFQWLVDIVDPVQTYVILTRDGEVIYGYGNEALRGDIIRMRLAIRDNIGIDKSNSIFSLTENGNYDYMERQLIRGHEYDFYVAARQPVGRNDNAIEKAFQEANKFVGICLVIFILGTSWFLSRFLIRRIVNPLKELKRGSEEIQEGNLDIHLHYDRFDEFTPVMVAFNLMSEKLKESLEEREKDEEKRKELIASISHDIRTPLTSIRAYVEGLLDNVADTPERRKKYLLVIQKKADVLERMIEQLMLLTKMDVGEKVLPQESINLSHLTKEIIDENKISWEKSGAEFETFLEDNVPIKGSHLLLERIMENLVTNSLKYKTEEKVKIFVTVRKEKGRAIFNLADDGPGVPEEALGRLLEAFYRTDKARSRTENGSGLGLAIVNRAASLMHGEIKVENRKPHGLSFTISYPLEGDHDKENTDR